MARTDLDGVIEDYWLVAPDSAFVQVGRPYLGRRQRRQAASPGPLLDLIASEAELEKFTASGEV